MIRIKICGITNLADAKAATDAGANSWLHFYEKSLRRIVPPMLRKFAPSFLRKSKPWVSS